MRWGAGNRGYTTDIHFLLENLHFYYMRTWLLAIVTVTVYWKTSGVDTGAGWRWRVIVRHVDKTGKYKVNICSSLLSLSTLLIPDLAPGSEMVQMSKIPIM